MKKPKKTKIDKKGEPKIIIVKRNIFKEFILPFIFSFSVIFIFIIFGSKLLKTTNKKKQVIKKPTVATNKLKEYLEIEQSVFLDPLELIDLIKNRNQEFVLIDLRENKYFQEEHIKRALSFSVKTLKDELKMYHNKLVILYGQTGYSKETRITAIDLINNGYQVKILSIGWNEFRHFKTLWVPESLWDSLNPDDYVESSIN